jgi:hypothetical protein
MKESLRDLVIDCGGETNDDQVEPTTLLPSPAPTFPPTLVPIATEPETVPPTESPTPVPVALVVPAPTASPVSPAPISRAPSTPAPILSAPSSAPQTEAPIAEETIRPAPTPPVPPPTGTSVAPTDAPFRFSPNAPVVANQSNGSSQCRANAACAARNLTGQCCPTQDDWTLACCGSGPIEQLCQGNAKCAALELTGACCPTTDDRYLDCCEIVPDECLLKDDGNHTEQCRRYSAVQYKLELQSARSNGISCTTAPWWSIMGQMTVSTVAMFFVLHVL